MSRRIYQDGVVLEEWDDDTTTYRRHEGDGTLVEERPYTDEEAAPIVARETEAQAETTTQRLRDQLASGVASIIAARDAAVADQTKAEGLRVEALDAAAATVTQRQAVAAFTPGAAYSAAQLGDVRDAIADVLARVEAIQGALAEFYAYRVTVDENAVLTDDALLWLARLASGALEDNTTPPPDEGVTPPPEDAQ